MKLLSFRRPDGSASWGIAKPEGVIDMGDKAPGLKHALWATTSLAEEAARHATYRLEDISFLPPIPDPEKILCIGLNYLSHIKEGGREPPPKPIIFTRYPNSQVGHGEAMVRPNASQTFDYEGELAVIIGKHLAAEAHLFFIAQAGDALGAFFGAGQRGQEHGGQNRDDGDDHQQFDEGERGAGRPRLAGDFSKLGGFHMVGPTFRLKRFP